MEIQGVNGYLLLCEDEDVNMDALDLRSDFAVRLGAYFKNAGPSPHLSHLDRYPFGGGTLLFVDLLRESRGAAIFQQPKSKHQKPTGPTSQLNNGKAHPSYGYELLTASSLKKDFAYYFKYFCTVSKIANFAPFREHKLGHPSFTEIHTTRPTDRNDPNAVSYQRYVFEWKSWLSSRDLFVNVLGKDNNTFAEAYNPHYVARQFGLMQMWPVSIPYLSQFKDPIQRAPLLSKAVKRLTMLQCKHMESMTFQHFDLQTGSPPSFKARINQVIRESDIFKGDMDVIVLNILMAPVTTDTIAEGQEMHDDDENEREEPQSSNTSSIKRAMYACNE
ncbi:hypothetical protein LINGRAHAP2_LOCUS13880 [Linum grandiflorum]